RTQLVPGERTEHGVERRLVGQVSRAVVAHRAPGDLVADTTEASGRERRSDGVRLRGFDVEVDSEAVSHLRRRGRVDIPPPRLEPVRPQSEVEVRLLL